MTSRIMLRRLTEVVQELYKAFKSYQARRHPEVCPCCVSDADKRQLFDAIARCPGSI